MNESHSRGDLFRCRGKEKRVRESHYKENYDLLIDFWQVVL